MLYLLRNTYGEHKEESEVMQEELREGLIKGPDPVKVEKKIEFEPRIRPTHMMHFVKCDKEVFEATRQGVKPYEVRLNDRDYQIGDKLMLQEWDSEAQKFTGSSHETGVITSILKGGQYGIMEGYVILSWVNTTESIVTPIREVKV